MVYLPTLGWVEGKCWQIFRAWSIWGWLGMITVFLVHRLYLRKKQSINNWLWKPLVHCHNQCTKVFLSLTGMSIIAGFSYIEITMFVWWTNIPLMGTSSVPTSWFHIWSFAIFLKHQFNDVYVYIYILSYIMLYHIYGISSNMWRCRTMGVPENGWLIMEHPMKMFFSPHDLQEILYQLDMAVLKI